MAALAETEDVLPPAPPLADIKGRITSGLEPVRPLPSSRVFYLLLAILLPAVLGAGTLWFGVTGWAALALPAKVSIFGPLLAGACLLGLAVVRQMSPAGGGVAILAAGSAASFLLVIAAVAHTFGWHEEFRSLRLGAGCLGVGLLYTVLAGLAAWLMMRRGAMLSELAAGALGGALAGFVGVAGIEMRCPNPDLAHILTWHMPVALAGLLAGVLLGLLGRHLRDKSCARVTGSQV